MSYQILSVIEVLYSEVNSIESFIINKENEKEQVNKAETLFIKKLKEIEETNVLLNNKIFEKNKDNDYYDYYVNNGSFLMGQYQLLLVWSTIVNV